MIKVLKVNADGTAVVKTAGLRRVVIQPSNEIVEELVTPREAKAYCRGFNCCEDGVKAKSVAYPQPKKAAKKKRRATAK